MTRRRIAPLIAVGSLLILLAGNAHADPMEVAEYKDPRSGDLFELFQEHDGSFFCSVQRKDGSLSGFEIEGHENRAPTGRAEGRPDLYHIAKHYYRDASKNGVRAHQRAEGAKSEVSGGGRRPEEPCPPPQRSVNRKTVSLLLLLMLSERGAS